MSRTIVGKQRYRMDTCKPCLPSSRTPSLFCSAILETNGGFPEIRGPLLGGVSPDKKELTTVESTWQPPAHGKYMKLLNHDGVVTGACHSMTVISFTL